MKARWQNEKSAIDAIKAAKAELEEATRETERAERDADLERAAELLLTTGLPVREVAARVGYRQPAQFAKSFRRHHGQAPSTYRKERRLAGSPGGSAPSEMQGAVAA